ncbi:MAG: type II toxin-antitoxin system RelE/ParE family toxin [Nitrolancea sp.]
MNQLETRERVAMLNVVEKLEQLEDRLPYPHSSAVKNTKLRELRPRAGRSRWRAFYRRVGDLLIIGAIGPEAKVDSRAFAHAVEAAEQRISEFERQETDEE